MLGRIDTILVDGYNVLHLWSHFRDLVADVDAKRRRLVAMLENYATLTRVRVVCVFDGSRPAGDEEIRSASVKVVFSRKGETADTLIESRLGSKPERTLVVSSDKALCSVCRMRGAEARSSEAFEHDLLEFLARSYAAEGDPHGYKVGDRVRKNALLTLLETLKDERARHEQTRMLAELARLRAERKARRTREEAELDELRDGPAHRHGVDPDRVRQENDEALRQFHAMYGDRKTKRRKREEAAPPATAAEEAETFDWVAAMEESLKGLDPKLKK